MDVDLEIVANDLNDDTHSSMDLQALIEIGGDPDEQRLSVLLRLIVGLSNGKLDSKYEQRSAAVALLADHPELRVKLMQAWGVRSFKEIRNLSMYCSALPSSLNNVIGTGILRPPVRPKMKSTGSSERILSTYSSMQGESASAVFLVTFLI